MAPYTANIPTANQFQSASQPLIQQNFMSLAPFQEGVANFPLVGDPVTANLPNATTALYSKLDGSGVPQLYIRDYNSGPIVNITGAIAANTGETILPSGIKLKWGRGLTNGAGILTFTFTGSGLTAFTNIFSVQATAASTVAPGHPEDQIVARVNAYSATGMTIETLRIQAAGGNPQAANVNWFAIGN